MEMMHGVPISWPAWEGRLTVMPAFHPAAAMRDPNKLAFTADDFEAFGKLIRGELKRVNDKHSPPEYREMVPSQGDNWPEVAIDTEGTPKEPWCLTWSTRPGVAGIVYAYDKARLAEFLAWLRRHRPLVILHNALWDLAVLRSLGIDLIAEGIPFTDTMVQAYLLQTEPQGLKPLAFRHHGMQMRGYEDVIYPAHQAAMREYLSELYQDTMPAFRLGKKGQELKSRERPSKLHSRVKRILGDYAKKPEKVDLADRYLKIPDEIRPDGAPKPTLDLVPPQVAIDYAGRDADATLRLNGSLSRRVHELGMDETLAMDIARLPVIDRMQQIGMPLDLARTSALSADLEKRMEDTLASLRLLVGDPEFNPSSSEQVGAELFGITREEFKEANRKQVNTTKRTLQTRSNEGDVVAQMTREYRELQKLKTTYVDQLPTFVCADCGRLHPRLQVTRVVSGRLSAKDPNLLAFPSRTPLGRQVRGCFVAPEGRLLGSWDHSQIEMRVAADESDDPELKRVFLEGLDIHTSTTERLFGIVADGSSAFKDKRSFVKNLNYGVLYGISADRLHKELIALGITKYSLDDCSALIREWFRLYAEVGRYMRHCIEEAKRLGYAKDRWGRIRKLPALYLRGKRWPNEFLRAEAERQAFNHHIQGGAHGFLERAMVKIPEIQTVVRAAGYYVEPLLEIHDELLLEFDANAWELVNPLMLDAMTADRMSVPIESSSSYGQSWGDLK